MTVQGPKAKAEGPRPEPRVPNPESQVPRTLRAAGYVMAAALVCGGAGLAQDARPLPDFDTFSRTVRENLARAERVAHLYAFTERRTDVHANPFGRIGTGGTRLFEVYPSAIRQLTYRRLVERNGVAVPAPELANQDRQYRARAADVQRRLAAEGVDERRLRDADSARARQRGQRRVDDVVAALQFKIVGRAMYEGVPAVVVSFAPKPGARPDTREGRAAQSFAGTIWVHEAAAEVMRVEAKSVDDLSSASGWSRGWGRAPKRRWRDGPSIGVSGCRHGSR